MNLKKIKVKIKKKNQKPLSDPEHHKIKHFLICFLPKSPKRADCALKSTPFIFTHGF